MASGKGRIDMKWFKRKAKSIVSKTVLATLAHITYCAYIGVGIYVYVVSKRDDKGLSSTY